MHRKVKEGELADCNGTSGHRGARCRSVHVEGSKPGARSGRRENWPTAMEHQVTEEPGADLCTSNAASQMERMETEYVTPRGGLTPTQVCVLKQRSLVPPSKAA